MIRLKIRDNLFKIIDGYRVNESSREVKFSSLTVDFTNKTITDLPLKYQECQLIEQQLLLPEEYTQVDYIRSDNDGWIDTELKLGNNFKIEIDFILNQYHNTEQPIISTWNSSNGYFNLFVRPTGTSGGWKNTLDLYVKAHKQPIKQELVLGEINHVVIERNNNDWKIVQNGTELTFSATNLTTNNRTLKMFKRGDSTGGSYTSISKLKIYENNNLIRNFIPCYRKSDEKAGVYDLINNRYYTNSGTDVLSYGNEIEPYTKIIYTGYVNNFVLPKMKNRNEYRELEIDLLSPLAMATVRTVDAIGTYELQSLVRELIQPLIDDGFVLKELNIGNNQITVNYLNETVESSLNKLSNKFNFWWYIDVNKNIYVNSITYLMSLQPKLIYDDNNKINGLIDIIPSIDATDYCNVVNFTNVRMYTESYWSWGQNGYDDEKIPTGYYPLFEKYTLNTGDEIEFNQPIDISPKAILNMYNSSNNTYGSKFALDIYENTEGHEPLIKLKLYLDQNNKLVIPNNATISDSYNEDNTWVLVRDSFFENLIVGLKYNGEPFEIYSVLSLTSLIWAKISVKDNVEINKNKGIINRSGIVEKIIDMNETWRTYNELVMIANSYIKTNTSKADTVKLNIDKEINLKIGDTIKINKDAFLVNDTYIITDKSSIYSGNVYNWNFTLKNTNVLENYVDLFRAEENPENETRKINLITADYIEEGIKEKYEVVINED